MGSFNICTLHNFVSIHVHNENFFHKNLGWGTKGNQLCVAMVSHDRLVGEFKIKKKPIEKKKIFYESFSIQFFFVGFKKWAVQLWPVGLQGMTKFLHTKKKRWGRKKTKW